jgi:hypothetical protein
VTLVRQSPLAGSASKPGVVTKKKLAPAALPPPQTSDMTSEVRPSGATRRTSTSSTFEWVRPFRVTPTSVITPVWPWTLIFDGEGDALPLLGIVICVSFVKSSAAEAVEVAAAKAAAAAITAARYRDRMR